MEESVSRLTDVGMPQEIISPVVGVFDAPVEPFAAAVGRCSESVPHIVDLAQISTFFAQRATNYHGLTQDEIAAINLYTIDCDFYKLLNRALRERDRTQLTPFFPYLRHLLLGLRKLPNHEGKLWRGVKGDLKARYPVGKNFFWWSLSSCTVHLGVLKSEQFCGKTGERTLFCISTPRGKDIKAFSGYASEGEVLLMPGYFTVQGVLEPGHGLTIIDIQELPPPFDIFVGTPKASFTAAPHFKEKFGAQGDGDGQFNHPTCVVVDGERIVVSDSGNHRVQVFGKEGRFICKFGTKGNGGGQFDRPYGVAVDGTHMFIADRENNLIRVFSKNGQEKHHFGNQGNGQLCRPIGIAVDSQNIIVSDTDRHRIQVFGKDGTFVRQFGSFGNGLGQFRYPNGIALVDDHILVADTDNHRIQVFRKDGKLVRMFGSKGNGDGQLNMPIGVETDGKHIFVADRDNHRIQIFGRDGTFILKFGSQGNGDGQFQFPRIVAVDGNHIIVADSGNHRIQIFEWSITLNQSDFDSQNKKVY